MKLALRALIKNPGFVSLAVLILALGIGATTAIFTVVNGVLLRPLVYPEPERIVTVQTQWRSGSHGNYIAAPDFHDLHDQSSAFSNLAYYYTEETSVITNGTARYAGTSAVTPDFFGVFGMAPLRGRLFSADEKEHGAPAEALVTRAFWRERFGAQPFDDRETLSFGDKPFSIIGIMPDGFDFPRGTQIWYPSWVWPENPERSAGFAFVVGRLNRGVTLKVAQAQVSAIAQRLAAAYPRSNKNKGFLITPLLDLMVADVRGTLHVLLAAVALVLLIACANVANLLLARGTARLRETGIRLALGASSTRVVGEVAAENALIAIVAGALGVLFAEWGVIALRALAPANLPRLDEIHIDGRVLLFGFVVTIIASLLAGTVPAWRSTRIDPNHALAQSGRRGVVGGAGASIRNALVIAEIALSVVLVVVAGLLIRSFDAMTAVNPGFNPQHLLVAEASVPAANENDSRRDDREYFEPMLQRLSQLPGVVSAAAVRGAPLTTEFTSWGAYIVSPQTIDQFGHGNPQAGFIAVSPSYFKTMQISLLKGRSFDDRDSFEAPSSAIISASLARESFPHMNPIGRKILCGWDKRTMKWMTIVGVAGDVHTHSLTSAPGAQIYMPIEQHPESALQFLVRSSGDPLRLASAIHNLSRSLNSQAALRVNTMENIVGGSVAAARFRTLLLSVFAALAMVLATAGVYSVMAYMVTQGTAEIGVRMAIGAEPHVIERMVLGKVGRLAGAGAILGVIGSVAASRLVASFLFNVKPLDPLTYGLMLVLLAAATILASFLPASRAARIDPIQALREE